MKYTEVLEKRALFDGAKKWVVDKYNQIADKTNQHVQSRYVEPQARAAADAATDQAFKTIGSYAVPTLVGAGAVGLLTHSVSEWINKRRKKDESKLPTGLLTTLGTIGGGLGSAYLWNRFGKHASLTYSDVAALQKQADEYDWWTKPNQATEYAAFEKRGPTDPTKQQEAEVFRMAWDNPGVAFTWDDNSRKYIPTQYDKNLKTNVPYKGNINTKAPATGAKSWDRWGSTQPKQAPAAPSTNTQGMPPKTNFTTPKPVTPVQPPQYRQADTKIKEGEWSRF